MPALLLGIGLLAGALLLVWAFSRANPQQVAGILKGTLLAVAAVFGLYLLLAGRYALAALLPILAVVAWRLRPSLGRWGLDRQGAVRGQRSGVRTPFLAMTLDHASGEAEGEVLAGRFQGRALASLSLAELLSLRDEVLADAESLALLEAWLDRRHPDWRAPPAGEAAAARRGEDMTRDEAYAILGLAADAGADEVKEAHRRLMQKLHPDRGGSDWLAAKLNRAKDVLLSS